MSWMTAHELETRHFSYLHTQSPDLQNRLNPVCPPPKHILSRPRSLLFGEFSCRRYACNSHHNAIVTERGVGVAYADLYVSLGRFRRDLKTNSHSTLT